MDKIYTVEELLSDETFTDFCLNEHSSFKSRWIEILSANAETAKAAEQAKAMLGLLSPVLSQTEINDEVNKLREYIGNIEEPKEIIQKRSNVRKVLAYGFSLILLVAVSAYFLLPRATSPTIASRFETKLGERKQYVLPDGSTVILSSNSSFSFDENFGSTNRHIEMTGDAFFKVAKDPSKPFIVTSNGFSTTAIGTAFYVHSGSSATDYRVDLLEGKVKLEKNVSGESSILMAGQKASWTKAISSFTKQQYDTISLNKWVQGVLSFNNTPVEDAFTEIENWYSVNIEDKRTDPEAVSINGDYINAPLEDVLKIICFSLSCSYQFEGNKIIIQ